MLERPSNIFERAQKCYKTFKRFITCYNGLYDNVVRCANRSNILFLTCCMTCLNGLPRALKKQYKSVKTLSGFQIPTTKGYCLNNASSYVDFFTSTILL